METHFFFFFFQKISKLNFDFCQRAEINIQVGFNIRLYDDIGGASSSLRGSIFSLKSKFWAIRRKFVGPGS